MITLNTHPGGRHALQIHGPSAVRDRTPRAISLPAIFARHQRWAAGVSSAVRAWGLTRRVPTTHCVRQRSPAS